MGKSVLALKSVVGVDISEKPSSSSNLGLQSNTGSEVGLLGNRVITDCVFPKGFFVQSKELSEYPFQVSSGPFAVLEGELERKGLLFDLSLGLGACAAFTSTADNKKIFCDLNLEPMEHESLGLHLGLGNGPLTTTSLTIPLEVSLTGAISNNSLSIEEIELKEDEPARDKLGICFSETINWRVKGKLKIHKVVNHRRFKQKRFLRFLLHGLSPEARSSIHEENFKKKEFCVCDQDDERRRLEAETITDVHMGARLVDSISAGKNSIQENQNSRVFCSQFFGTAWLDDKHYDSKPLSSQLESYIAEHVTNEIVQFNLKGLGTEGRDTAISSVVNLEKAAVVFIQETKMDHMDDFTVRSLWGVADRTRIWSELDEVRAKWPELPWCIGGDYNVIRVSSEKNTPSASDVNMRRFDSFLRRHELCDLPLNGGLFTWSNMQIPPILCRLDRFVVSGEWEDKFHLMAQCVLTRTVSDHSPLSLRSGGILFGPFPFKVEIFWLEHPSFKDLMFFWWNSMCFEGSSSFIFAKKLQMLKSILKGWSKETFGNLDKKLRELEVLIDILDKKEEVSAPISDVEILERASHRRHYNEVLVLIAKKWKLRAKIRWHEDGERNTKMFHKIANGNRRKNAMFKLMIGTEEVVCQDRIIKEVTEFYEKLYTRDQEEDVDLEELSFSTISETQSTWLEREISEDEIMSTIKSFKLNKSPGPDGFPIEFYKVSWEVIKNDFMKVVKEFNEIGGVNWRLNFTFLSLIPKKKDAVQLKDFRPISLVSTIYKIFSKVLANRLKVVIPNLISQSQGAFLAERQILDGILIANELIDSRKMQGKEGIVCKLDMEKAYDHVLWGSVEGVLKKMGFGLKWRRWVRNCISNARFSVIINGAAKGFFKSSQGLRQGDPLSPFLFLLVAEVFNKLMNNAKSEGCLKGFYVKENGMEVSHLQFADDTIVFLDAKVEEVQKLMEVLESFKAKTGLKVNLSKSAMMGIGVQQECIQECAGLAGCAVGEFPISYLGIPIGAFTRLRSVWNVVIERMILKLAPWKTRYLSKAGRVELINNAVASIPLYYLSLFQMPISVAKKLEKLMRNFLWGDTINKKSLHWRSWKKVSVPKSEGGLGIRNLKVTNDALLTKWLWRYGEEKMSLWRKIIFEKFGGIEEVWLPKDSKRTYGWGLWRGILNQSAFLKNGSKISIGRGNKTNFWDDVWCHEKTLRELFPKLWKISRKKEATVEDIYIDDGAGPSWNIDPCRRLKDQEIQDVTEFSRLLDDRRAPVATDDKREWTYSPKGMFSVSSCYAWLMHDQGHITPPKFPSKYIWNKTIPPKVSFLVWAAANRVVPTLSMLSRRGMIVVNLCGFCDNNEESVEHLFLHFPFIWKIWEHLLQQLGFAWVHPTTIIDFSWKWKLKFSTKPLVFLRYCLPFALWWVVWLERNDIQIAKKQGRKTLNSLIIDIKLLLLSWYVNVDSFKNMKLDDFVFDWKILFRE
ncbi:uncharacterized protein LOC113336795 [Papaver somniferum]|uniref:uncharacterized protein LOC113336795 n=1 Tax=Papaver somniferum TaxID=3469 RepID=UPI000E700283|nr:uncharacterized protein LOC113336795 [Papaver somniferum]